MKSILLLGSTGSVGENTLRIVAERPDCFRIVGLAAGRNSARLAEQVRAFRPEAVAVAAPEAEPALREAVGGSCRVQAGPEAVLRLVDECSYDVAVQAITGAAGLPSTLALLERGARVALANKESLVAAGEVLMPLARSRGAEILPVDSEHSAIFQCLRGERLGDVRRVYLTGSGGAFRERPLDAFGSITPEEALRHPNWSMGPRITVDSATMMNKAFEVIEAHHLFGLSSEQIEVLLHPQSLVHSMVEFRDGSILAQLGLPDMRIPIHYALTHPERGENGLAGFEPSRFARLTFETVEPERFPAVALGYRCVREGGASGAVLNAADEVAVERFLAREIGFPDLVACVRAVLDAPRPRFEATLEGVFAADAWARQAAAGWTS
ncbi:MAG TPA: 1-deoxy-D-xylulose-5-phosphate reductoisomerase [Planctomycetota bacterium]|jgi:1-deoxy-D-xylulose-5-phosphate reductoisomerase|nr:1-deoxy-D-xylulose-5-phosphate reductoisomerase [Planctomycetota bacterium]